MRKTHFQFWTRTACLAGSITATTLATSSAFAADVAVSALSQNGWYSDDTRGDGSGVVGDGANLISPTLTALPEQLSGNVAHDAEILAKILFLQAPGTVPPGTWTGAVNLKIAASSGGGKRTISHRKDDGIGHASTSVLAPGFSAAYSWMGNNSPSNPNIGAALKIGIKTSEFGSISPSLKTGENSWDKLLVYEPYFNGSPADGLWHTQNISFTSGNWWIVDRTSGVGNSQNNPMPLSAMAGSAINTGGGSPRTVGALWSAITAPGSHITNIQFGCGSGNPGANVYVNQLVTSFYRPGDRLIFGPPPPSLSLNPTSVCYTGGQVVVKIRMTNQNDLIVGGQYFLEYDETMLDFVSATPGAFPYTEELYESVNEPAGTIDYAVGVLAPHPGVMADTDMVTLTFNPLGQICDTADLIKFRSHVPPTRLTNFIGGSIVCAMNNLPSLTVDTIAPVITCAPNISVHADAGLCTAVVDLNSTVVDQFNVNPALSPTQAPGTWYVDRYAPAGFVSAIFSGGNRLKHSISAADCESCRPPAYTSAFYNTQGRKFDIPGTTTMSIDLYIPAAWATTNKRMAGFWGTAFNISNVVSLFPIIEFTSDGGVPRFRGWDDGVWIDMGLPTGFAYDTWRTLTITLTPGTATYTVGDLNLSVTAYDSVQINNVILQGHNNAAGVTYDIYWDNFSHGTGPMAADSCTANPTLVGVRSDAQPLNAPYPGNATTTITWTATDSCGNSSQCNQTVTVSGYNEILATVQLSPNISPLGSLTRCIRFEAWACPGAVPPVDVTATFSVVAGVPANVATAANVSVLVPCGMNYTCLTARDRLHTLRRTVTMPGGGLSIVGNKYVANFTGDPSSGGDWLIGGNLNDDQYIDVLDFGIFVGQSGAVYGSGSTTCSTAYPHADVSGDGVVSTSDFLFIQINFLKFHEANCCGAALRLAAGGGAAPSDGSDGGPVTRISVKELLRRGFVEAIAGDINHDQWLDTQDVQTYLANGGPSNPYGNR